MENIIVSMTNLSAIGPIVLSFMYSDYWTMFTILFVAIFSFLSHLVQNHKHCMPGIGFSQNISRKLNEIDIFGCVFVIIRFEILLQHKYILNYAYILTLLILILINFYSESDKINQSFKIKYIVSHSIWHIGIFIWLQIFLMEYYGM